MGFLFAAQAADSVMVPNFSPGSEYADSARMFQGIPGIERAANGRLWATWYGGGVTENEKNYVMLYTSGDNGRSWQRVLILDPDGAGPLRAFDPCLWHDPGGKLWLFWSQHTNGQVPTSEVLAITTSDSGNAEAEWSAPRKVCQGIMMNKPTAAKDGRWLLPVATWHADGSARVVVSTDQGITFAELGSANIPEVKDRNCDEHMLVERKDGSLWMLLRTRYGIGESVSTDSGKTWPDVKAGDIPHPVARFFIRRLASGQLLLVRHNPPNGKSRSHLTAFLSDDDGLTWKGGLLLDERDGVSYPDGVQVADGTIYVTYDYQRQRDKEILMAVVTEEDILKGKLISSNSRLRVLINKATGINSTVTPSVQRNPNSDGAMLLNESAAEFECADGQSDTFESGVKLFSNRAHIAKEVPEALRGFKIIRSSIDSIRAVCRQSGVVYVITPSPGRNKDSLAAALLESGFQKVSLPEFLLFNGGNENLCSVYQKKVAVDESLVLGKWGVLVVPGKD